MQPWGNGEGEQTVKTYARTVAVIVVAMIVSSLWTGVVGAATVTISGSVTNPSGFGIVSVTVAALDPVSGNTVASATTDASGDYTVSVASGTYTLTATPPAGDNYQRATKTNQSITADTIVTFVLVPVTGTVALNGKLQDGLGNGIPNQQLNLGGQQVFTDATGHYAFQVTPGTYTLEGSQHSFWTAPLRPDHEVSQLLPKSR